MVSRAASLPDAEIGSARDLDGIGDADAAQTAARCRLRAALCEALEIGELGPPPSCSRRNLRSHR